VSGRGPLAAFFAFGLFWGAWGVLVPAIKDQTGASVSELGVALVFVAATALPAMLGAGVLLDRFGLRLLPLAAVAFGASVLLPGVAGSVWTLALALAVVGATSGALDVAINVAATTMEARRSVRLIQRAHALFSAGFLTGAVLVGVAREAGAGPLPILAAVSAAVMTAAWLNRDAARLAPPPRAAGPRLRLTRPLVLLGLLCAVAFVVEGGIEAWSALFLESELGASPALGALGPGFFAAAMVLGRLLGERAEAYAGDLALLVGGAAVAASGLTLAAASGSVPPAVAGFFLGGVGVSVAAPTLFGAGGRSARDHERGSSVATVTTVAYLGFVAGPPLVGAISGAFGLRAGIALLAATAASLAVLSASLARAVPLRRLQPAERG
jgi:MFS family permease